MYNPYPGQYSQYGAGPGAIPGAPPAMSAPGTGAPPGLQQQDAHQQARPAYPPNFQPPANMPHINFAAPVIRLGAGPKPDTPGGRDDRDRPPRRPGLGSGMGGDYRERERPQPIQPQTKEEIIRTVFVGGITDAAGVDDAIERILRAAGNLRKWFRATDADDKPCNFGFAEYEDAESLATAIEVLNHVELPIHRPTTDDAKDDGDNDKPVEKSLLLIVADENSHTYLEQWEESQGGIDTNQKQMLIDQAQHALRAVLADLENPQSRPNDHTSGMDRDGDTAMPDDLKPDNNVVTIQLSVDDELADIPAEMRETVAKEITAFRDRSNRRDLERLKREEDIEQAEKSRMMNGSRSRLGSPPSSAPTGPGATNGVPSGPRGPAPTGPKAQASAFPKDYTKGVTFVNGTGISAASAFEEDGSDASDSELEQRRQAKKDADVEKDFLDQERRWLNRERSRTAAVEREKTRDQEDLSRITTEKEAMANRLHEWNDDVESTRKEEEYYRDRGMWIRNRAAFRQREAAADDADRAAELRDRARDVSQREIAGQMADDFLSRQTDILAQPQPQSDDPTTPTESSTRREPARFKMSLGAAAQQRAHAASQAAAASQNRRPITDVEGLLEDEDATSSTKANRKLIPIPDSQLESTKAQSQDLTDEERTAALQSLASEIPTDKDALFDYKIHWSDVDEEEIIGRRLKDFVERKVVDLLGVQEQMLVDVVIAALRDHKKPGAIVEELEGAVGDEDAEALVKKLWRMVVFYSESGRRGLGT